MTDYSDGHARQLEDILEDLSAGRSTVAEAAESIRRQSPPSIHRPRRTKKSGGLALLITVVGTLFLGIAGIIGLQSRQFTANAAITQGTVSELVRSDQMHKPRYRYEVDGVEYTGLSATGSNPPRYQVGDVVEIEYLRDEPASSRMATWAERWTGALAVAVMGAGITLVGFVMLVVRWLSTAQ